MVTFYQKLHKPQRKKKGVKLNMNVVAGNYILTRREFRSDEMHNLGINNGFKTFERMHNRDVGL